MPLLITGATPRPPPGELSPARLEISTFVEVRNIKQFSLYIQALEEIFGRSKTATDSHYQISGVHGMPYVEWNDSPIPGPNRGYCVHRTEVFPTWHRPYVVLIEQEVQRIAKRIAATYPESDRPAWEKAAADLRQPYWGWDDMETVIPPPEVISMDRVEIIKPSGQTSVTNPFLAYKFPDEQSRSMFPRPLNGWDATARHADENGHTNVERLRTQLTAIRQQVVDDTRYLYSVRDWRTFVLSSPGSFTRGLEAIHDTIHLTVGGRGGADGRGHMSYVPAAAFDPIFYLHHAQVDRVVDKWYSIHRDWTTDSRGLNPFWNTPTTYWVSPNIIDTAMVFNYDYPIGPLADDVKASSAEALENPAHNPAGHNPLEVRDDPTSLSAEGSRDGASNTINEWSVSIKCKPFEVGGSFSIIVFLGEVPTDPEQWLTDPAFAGTFDVFANSNPDECANCIDQADEILHGFVHVNRAILKRSEEHSLEPDVVLPYLESNLNWGVIKVNGEVVEAGEVPSLEVTVLVTPLTLHEGAEFPSAGEPHYYHDITYGRPGGARHH